MTKGPCFERAIRTETRLCQKTLFGGEPKVAVDERHLDHAGKVFGGLFEAREDSSTLLQPSDELFDDAPAAVGTAVEADDPRFRELILLSGNDRFDSQLVEILVDPVRAVRFVARQRPRPGNTFTIAVDKHLVGCFQQALQHGGLVILARRQMKMQGVTATNAEQMDFRRKTAARTA